MARQMLCVRTMALILIPPLLIIALLAGAGGSKALILKPGTERFVTSNQPLTRSLRRIPVGREMGDQENPILSFASDDIREATPPQGTSGPNPTFSASNYNPCANQSVQFRASNIAGATYAWDFGDGSQVSGTISSVMHSYMGARAYNVTLTVTVSSGSATSTQPVFVTSCVPISGSQVNWFFGFFGELHFNSGEPLPGIAARTHETIFSSEASITQSDATGNLLFYSDGKLVWNNQHVPVNDNANERLSGGNHPGQALSVPDPAASPDNPSSFYLISMPGYSSSGPSASPSPPEGDFGYTKVSVSGSILTLDPRNTPIAPPVDADKNIAEMVTAVPGCGTNYWIIVHGSFQGDPDSHFRRALFVYPLNSGGVGTPDVYPIVGPALFGTLKASPDGTRVAYGTGDERSNGYSYVLDFNRSTGVLSNPRVISRYAYGVSFSPNSRLLYFTETEPISGSEKIFQYDLNDNLRERLVAEVPAAYSALQLGPDNKIYVALNGSNHLAVINYPDERNTVSAPNACGYSFNGPSLNIPSSAPLAMSSFGLPNMIDARKPLASCCRVITLNPEALPAAVVNTPYSQGFTATGGLGPYTFTVSNGTLPQGMSLDAAGLHGTPVTPGLNTFTVRATDANGCVGSREYQINVCPVISLNPAAGALPGAVVNTPYSQTFTATGGCSSSFTYKLTGGLPSGLALGDATGVLSGTTSDPGDFTFTVTATDGCGCSQAQIYALRVHSPLMISRFRENGPAGGGDEFVEIFNPSSSTHTVASANGSGYGVFASAGNGTTSNDLSLACRMLDGTVIPARGYFLCAGASYSLGNLGRNGGVAGATALGDAAILVDIPNDAGLALSNFSALPASNSLVFDKVGFMPYGPSAPAPASPSIRTSFCEGTCLQPVGDASLLGACANPTGLFPVIAAGPACYGQAGQYEFLRRQTLFDSSVGTLHRDTGNNADDFILVSPNPALDLGQTVTGISGVRSVLGAAGPQGSAAPPDTPSTILTQAPFDVGSQLGPRNAERNYAVDPTIANWANDPQGTFSLRFLYTNNSGRNITGLRFRVDEMSTLCGPQTGTPAVGTGEARNVSSSIDCGTGSFTAILKLLNSAPEVVVDSTSTARIVNGTVMEDLSKSLTPPVPPITGPLSPLGGGIDNSIIMHQDAGGIIGHTDSSGFVGDGVTGGSGSFNTTMATSGPTSVLRVRVKFGVVKGGRFIVLITPMAKFSPASAP